MNKAVEIIKWYESLPRDYNDIDSLLHARKKLSVANFNLATDISNKGIEHSGVYTTRKICYAKAKSNLECQMSSTKAETLATIEIEEIIKSENTLEAHHKGLKILFDATNKVLDAMASNINYLRDEKQKINHTT